MGFLAWLKGGIAGSAVVGLGVICFIFTTPTDEELINKLSPELKQKYYDERQRRQFVGNWAYQEALKTSKSNDPVWMTGDIPSGLVRGEDGAGKRLSAETVEHMQKELKQNPDRVREMSEGLQIVPPSLLKRQNEWEKKTDREKELALGQERERLRKLAEKEEKL